MARKKHVVPSVGLGASLKKNEMAEPNSELFATLQAAVMWGFDRDGVLGGGRELEEACSAEGS